MTAEDLADGEWGPVKEKGKKKSKGRRKQINTKKDITLPPLEGTGTSSRLTRVESGRVDCRGIDGATLNRSTGTSTSTSTSAVRLAGIHSRERATMLHVGGRAAKDGTWRITVPAERRVLI